MKNIIIYTFTILLSIALLQACGQEEDTMVERDEQAIQDSLEQAYQAELEQMRRDSIEQVRADSLAAAEEEQRIEFSEDGNFTVQVEAWRSRVKAQQQVDKWKERGYDQSMIIEYGDAETGDVWYRVQIGPFNTLEMAEKFQNRLKEDYDTQSWISEASAPVEP